VAMGLLRNTSPKRDPLSISLKESRKETGKLFAKTKMGLIQEASVL
jgi:hypothetical protein